MRVVTATAIQLATGVCITRPSWNLAADVTSRDLYGAEPGSDGETALIELAVGAP